MTQILFLIHKLQKNIKTGKFTIMIKRHKKIKREFKIMKVTLKKALFKIVIHYKINYFIPKTKYS